MSQHPGYNPSSYNQQQQPYSAVPTTTYPPNSVAYPPPQQQYSTQPNPQVPTTNPAYQQPMTTQAGYPPATQYPVGYQQVPPPYAKVSPYPQQSFAQYPTQPVSHGQTPFVHFDQGARITQAASIPPPPPGVLPTAAQMAYAQGQPVNTKQQKRDVWGGGSDGGATFF